jgi:hypothetical protein
MRATAMLRGCMLLQWAAKMSSVTTFNGTAAANPNTLISVLVTEIQCTHVHACRRLLLLSLANISRRCRSSHAADAAWLDSCDKHRNEER